MFLLARGFMELQKTLQICYFCLSFSPSLFVALFTFSIHNCAIDNIKSLPVIALFKMECMTYIIQSYLSYKSVYSSNKKWSESLARLCVHHHHCWCSHHNGIDIEANLLGPLQFLKNPKKEGKMKVLQFPRHHHYRNVQLRSQLQSVGLTAWHNLRTGHQKV